MLAARGDVLALDIVAKAGRGCATWFNLTWLVRPLGPALLEEAEDLPFCRPRENADRRKSQARGTLFGPTSRAIELARFSEMRPYPVKIGGRS